MTADPLDAMSQSELEEVIQLWPTGTTERTAPVAIAEIGALSQWRAELVAGARTRLTDDTLFRAACAEANARDAMSAGIAEAAYSYRHQAAEIVLRAAENRRGAA